MPKKNILLSVNKVYKEQNPSNYFNFSSKKNINQFVTNKKKFLTKKLKLLPKIFKNSELLDLGCGSGQNTIYYDWLGAKCTLVDYDKNSIIMARNLFAKYAKNNFKVINKDLFKLKLKKKYDFVISNGVAHHTSDTIKNIKLAINFLKKDGILILGLGENNGFFQRNLQRYILYSLSKNKNEQIKLAKLFFSENLKRAKKYGGRTISEIIYDTYINPRIYTLSFEEIKKVFKNNKIDFYSSDEDNFNYIEMGEMKNFYYNMRQMNYGNNKNLEEQKFLLNALLNFSSLESSYKLKNENSILLKKISDNQNKLTNIIKNQSIYGFKRLKIDSLLQNYKKMISQLKKIDIIDKKQTLTFLSEVSTIFNILNSKSNKVDKITSLMAVIKKNKLLFKGRCGKGMNYYVGTKI
jgi:SAM-dependent methyltransferase